MPVEFRGVGYFGAGIIGELPDVVVENQTQSFSGTALLAVEPAPAPCWFYLFETGTYYLT